MGVQVTRSDDKVIHEIDRRLDRARQQEQYFLELEEEELDEADKHDRLVQKYKSIRDLNRASRERVLRQRHRMEANFYADKADHYTAKIQKLKARRSAIYERAEEERRSQFEVLLQNNKNCAQEESCEESLHRVETIEKKGSNSNEGELNSEVDKSVFPAVPLTEFEEKVEEGADLCAKYEILQVCEIVPASIMVPTSIMVHDHALVKPMNKDVGGITGSTPSIFEQVVGVIDWTKEFKYDDIFYHGKTVEESMEDTSFSLIMGSEEDGTNDQRMDGIYSFNFYSGKIGLPQVLQKGRIYSKYLFRWNGSVQTSDVNSGSSSFEEWVTDVGGTEDGVCTKKGYLTK